MAKEIEALRRRLMSPPGGPRAVRQIRDRAVAHEAAEALRQLQSALEQRTKERDEQRGLVRDLTTCLEGRNAELSSLRESAGALERLEKWLSLRNRGSDRCVMAWWHSERAEMVVDLRTGLDAPGVEDVGATTLSAAIDAALAKAGEAK